MIAVQVWAKISAWAETLKSGNGAVLLRSLLLLCETDCCVMKTN